MTNLFVFPVYLYYYTVAVMPDRLMVGRRVLVPLI